MLIGVVTGIVTVGTAVATGICAISEVGGVGGCNQGTASSKRTTTAVTTGRSVPAAGTGVCGSDGTVASSS